jgi:hypothetical protein
MEGELSRHWADSRGVILGKFGYTYITSLILKQAQYSPTNFSTVQTLLLNVSGYSLYNEARYMHNTYLHAYIMHTHTHVHTHIHTHTCNLKHAFITLITETVISMVLFLT